MAFDLARLFILCVGIGHNTYDSIILGMFRDLAVV